MIQQVKQSQTYVCNWSSYACVRMCACVNGVGSDSDIYIEKRDGYINLRSHAPIIIFVSGATETQGNILIEHTFIIFNDHHQHRIARSPTSSSPSLVRLCHPAIGCICCALFTISFYSFCADDIYLPPCAALLLCTMCIKVQPSALLLHVSAPRDKMVAVLYL